MKFYERILYFLNNLEMDEPVSFGWFHFLWIFLTLLGIFILYKYRKQHNDKQLKKVLLIYGITALILELIKQIMWSFNYDINSSVVSWNYEWYAFPFQLCSTPIYVSIICAFLKGGKVRDSLLSYMAFITILGSIATIIIPDSCFVEDIVINIHTMWLHCGSLVVSIYLIMTGFVKINISSLIKGIISFIIFVFIALFFNIIIYNSGILNGETFNMFYISPYFISTLPVFDIVQKSFPYPLFLITYLCVIITGSFIVYGTSFFVKNRLKNNRQTSN